jgi:hypothetical protein
MPNAKNATGSNGRDLSLAQVLAAFGKAAWQHRSRPLTFPIKPVAVPASP